MPIRIKSDCMSSHFCALFLQGHRNIRRAAVSRSFLFSNFMIPKLKLQSQPIEVLFVLQTRNSVIVVYTFFSLALFTHFFSPFYLIFFVFFVFFCAALPTFSIWICLLWQLLNWLACLHTVCVWVCVCLSAWVCVAHYTLSHVFKAFFSFWIYILHIKRHCTLHIKCAMRRMRVLVQLATRVPFKWIARNLCKLVTRIV